MKNVLTITLLLFSISFSFSQEQSTNNAEAKFDKNQFLKELSENACKCIDSIKSGNKTKADLSAEIHDCINKQVGAYQLGTKIAGIEDFKKETKEVNGKKEINISINTNVDSKEYKEYYYEIERYLVDTCPEIKDKIATNDIVGEKSYSNNSEAIKFYNLGLDESKKENFAKAIENYKKAIVYDPNFAFCYDNIGICYRRLNDFDKAIEYYEKSLKIDPNGLMPLQNIAIVYQYKKEYKKAVKAYERLAKIDNTNPEVFYGIGQIYTQYLFDYEKGLENLCQAYNIYVDQKSPYRTDAEKLINFAYSELKKQGKEDKFNEILKKYKISSN